MLWNVFSRVTESLNRLFDGSAVLSLRRVVLHREIRRKNKTEDAIWRDKRNRAEKLSGKVTGFVFSGDVSSKSHYCFCIGAQILKFCVHVVWMCFLTPEAEAEPAREPGERLSKRRCFWEYRRARETATKKKLGGDVHWSLSWSASTLPSTLYRREGETSTDQSRDQWMNQTIYLW